MENRPMITMGGRFRLFPLATITGNGACDERKERHPSLDLSPTPIAVKEERKLSSAPADTEPQEEKDGARGAPEEVQKDLPPAKKEYKLTPEPPDTDFRKEFPPDPVIGSELDEAARVWRVYRREAEAFDRTLLQGWSETLDILLIFAALFSAVATAFVIESYQLLQLDNSAYTAAALYNLVVVGSQSTAAVPLPTPPDLAFKSPISRWINGLWFTSILLSLAVGLLSILAKQWITEYRARNNASARNPREWARRREIYFKALSSWPVAEVVALLPVLLHLSLFLFFAGVVAFLWTLDQAIAVWLVVLGAFLGIFYMACTLIPLTVPESPTSTPLAMLIRIAVISTVLFSLKSGLSVLRQARRISVPAIRRFIRGRATWCCSGRFSARLRRRSQTLLPTSASSLSVYAPSLGDRLAAGVKAVYEAVIKRFEAVIKRFEARRSDKSGIRPHLEQKQHELDASALLWLIFEVSDSDAVAVGIQALGASRWDSRLAHLLRGDNRLAYLPESIAFTRSASERTTSEVLRVSRSVLVMCLPHRARIRMQEWVTSWSFLADNEYPDIALLRLQLTTSDFDTLDRASLGFPDPVVRPRLHKQCDTIAVSVTFWREASPSLASTASCALRANPDPTSFVNVLCCDLDHWSDAEWQLAVTAVTKCTPNHVPDFARPFYLASYYKTHHIRSNLFNHSWVYQSLRRILHHVREPMMDLASSYNRLNDDALNFLASQYFHRLRLCPKTLVTLSSYFRLDEQLAPLFDLPSASHPELFWGSFTRVVYALISSPSLEDVDIDQTAKVCSHGLRVLLTLENISRSSILNLFLKLEQPYSHDFMAVPASLWAMLGTMTNRSGAWVEVAAALAAYLDIYLHAKPDTQEKPEWIDNFFAELSDDTLLCNAAAWNTPEQFVHLFQHCTEIRPNWCSGIVDRIDSYELKTLHQLACERGRCESCSEFRPEYAP